MWFLKSVRAERRAKSNQEVIAAVSGWLSPSATLRRFGRIHWFYCRNRRQRKLVPESLCVGHIVQKGYGEREDRLTDRDNFRMFDIEGSTFSRRCVNHFSSASYDSPHGLQASSRRQHAFIEPSASSSAHEDDRLIAPPRTVTPGPITRSPRRTLSRTPLSLYLTTGKVHSTDFLPPRP